jgi:hypothetical protein
MTIRELWSRVVGLRGWNEEARALHNVEGDDSPPPGETEPTPFDVVEARTLTPEEHNRKYEEWAGEDPGH